MSVRTLQNVKTLQSIALVIMAAVIFWKLRVPLAEVLNRVEQVGKQLAEIQATVDAVWIDRIEAVSATLADQSADRLFRSDFERWRAQVKELNPDLHVPDLPGTPACQTEEVAK